MNKLFTKIVGAALGLTMAIGVGVAVGSNVKEATPVHAASATYNKVTSAPSSWSGTYLIGSPTKGWVMKSTDVVDSTSNYTSDSKFSADTDSVTGDYSAYEFTVTSYSTGYTIAATTGNYIYGGGSSTNKLNIGTTQYAGTFSFTSKNEINYTANGGYLRANDRFRFYKASSYTSSPAVTLYKKAATKTVSSISVKTAPTKTTYYAGEYFNPNGLVITATYSDSTTADISYSEHSSDFTFSPTTSTALTTSNKSVTITYATKTASQAITVNEARTLSSISISGYTTTFDQGDAFKFGGTVTANYSSGDPANVTSSATFSGYDMSTSGSQTVTVSYTESGVTKTATYTITVNEKVIDQYELIKSTNDLSVGSSYLIGNVAGTAFMSTTQNGNNRGKQDPGTAASNDVVEYTEGFEVLTLGGEEGAWTFYANNPEESASGAKGFLYAASSSSNYLKTQASNNANGEWSIAISDSGGATIIAQGTYTRNKIRYNHGNNPPIFSCYASDSSTGSEPALWKKVDTSESIALNKDSVSDMKRNTNHEAQITAHNFTPTTISATYSVANIASVTAGTISDGIIPLNVSCTGVGSTVATITVNGGSETHTIDLSITVTQKPASLTLVNQYIDHGEIEVKYGGTRQISFTALDTDGEDYSIDYSGITASSTNVNVSLTGTKNMVLNGDHEGDAVVTCTITATAGWQTPITQTLTVHVIKDYNEKNVSISGINNVNVDQGETLVITDHISSATATTHFGTNNNPIEDDELLFSYTNNRSAGVVYSEFVWDVTNPDLDAGDTETRTVYVFVTFNESYAGTSFTAVIEVKDRSVVGLLVDGVAVDPEDEIPLEIPRNSTYNLNEHVTVNPTNATESHQLDYAVEVGEEYVSINASGVISTGSKTGNLAYVSVTSHAHSEFVVYFDITITRETMTITADVPVEAYVKVTKAADLTSGDYLIVCESEGVAFNGSLETLDAVSNTISPTISSGTIATNDTTNASVFTYDASANTLKSKSGYYIGNTSNSNALSSSTSEAYTNTLSIDNDGNANIVSSGGAYLRYNKTSNQTRFRYYKSSSYTGQQAIQLYKLSNSSTKETSVTVSDELFNIVNAAMTASNGVYGLNLCDSSGTTFNTSAWNTLGSSFTSTIIEDNELAYARADQNGNEIEQFLYVYDYVIGKKEAGFAAYSGANDFLGRVASGKIIASSARISLIGNIANDINATAIIIVVSLTSLTAIGGYFFFRKRKED